MKWFQESTFQLTPEQEELVDSRERLTIGVACPGSGKTATLIERAKRLELEHSKTLVTTFTKKCQEEVSRRLDSTNHVIKVQTVHGFAYQIVRDNWESLGKLMGPTWPEEPVLLTEDDEQELILSEYPEKGAKRLIKLLKEVRKFETAPGNLITLQSQGVFFGQRSRSDIMDYARYEAHRVRTGALMIHDLIPLAEKAVQNPHVSLATYSGFKNLMVDEAQDLSLDHWKLLEPFLFDVDATWLIGDYNQSIFGYAGGNGVVLRTLMDRPDARVLGLTYNFRSGKKIVEFINEIPKANPHSIPTAVKAGEVQTHCFSDQDGEAEWIKGNVPEGAAILSRTNRYLEQLEKLIGPNYEFLTIHQAKGREWPTVVMAGCHPGMIPHPMSQDHDEERNIFYVGCSRAQERLVITSVKTPCVYLKEIDEKVYTEV